MKLDAGTDDEVRTGCHLIVNWASNLVNNAGRMACSNSSGFMNDSWIIIIIIQRLSFDCALRGLGIDIFEIAALEEKLVPAD